jgi:uncharacterized protein
VELAPEIIALLVGIAVIAGFVDAIAGGGGLLTLPALLLAGINPVAALATNKVQATFGTGSATLAFIRAGRIEWRFIWPLALASCLGAILGTAVVMRAPISLLQTIMPILLVIMAIYFAFSPSLKNEDAHARLTPLAFAFAAAAPIGFYDGIFGPGTGSFFMLAFISLLGFGIVRATAHTKLLNFTSNIASFAMFAYSGQVIWALGLMMGAGQFIGGQLGARMAMRHGARIIRPLLVVMCTGMAIRLMWNEQSPLRVLLAPFFTSMVQ